MTKWKYFAVAMVASLIVSPGISDLISELEKATFPVITNQSSYYQKSGNGNFCWIWKFDKKRNIAPETFTWSMYVTRKNEKETYVSKYYVTAWHANQNRLLEVGKTNTTNDNIVLPLCVNLPIIDENVTNVRIEGRVEYESTYGLRTVTYKIPPVSHSF